MEEGGINIYLSLKVRVRIRKLGGWFIIHLMVYSGHILSDSPGVIGCFGSSPDTLTQATQPGAASPPTCVQVTFRDDLISKGSLRY